MFKKLIVLSTLLLAVNAHADDRKGSYGKKIGYGVDEEIQAQYDAWKEREAYRRNNRVVSEVVEPIYVYDRYQVAPRCTPHPEGRYIYPVCTNREHVSRTIRRQVGWQTVITYGDGRQTIIPHE